MNKQWPTSLDEVFSFPSHLPKESLVEFAPTLTSLFFFFLDQKQTIVLKEKNMRRMRSHPHDVQTWPKEVSIPPLNKECYTKRTKDLYIYNKLIPWTSLSRPTSLNFSIIFIFPILKSNKWCKKVIILVNPSMSYLYQKEWIMHRESKMWKKDESA